VSEYIICPFSKPEYAQNLIDGIRRQRRQGSRVVVVENGPAVGSFPRMEGAVILRSDAHQSAAKNVGLDWVRMGGGGRWSVFDCDDYYGPGYLDDQMTALDGGADTAGKAYGSLMYIRFEEGIYLDGMKRTSDAAKFLNGGATSCATADVPDFPMTKVGEDGEWHKLMVKRGAKTVNTGAQHYCYNRVGSGHTWDPGAKSMEMQKKRMVFLGDLNLSSCDLPPRAVVENGGQSVGKVVMLHTADYTPAEVAVPDTRAYCKLWGYDLRVYSEMIRPDWPAAWNKIPAVVEAMASVGEGEWVLWMDCDMLMVKIEIPLEVMLRPEKDFMVSVDQNGICTGYFFIRNVPLMREFMSDLMKDMRPDWPWEQDAAKELIAARPDYAARVGHIPESVVQNPLSRDSVHAMVMHYWGNSFSDRRKLPDTMRKEIRLRDEVGGRHRRPWMKRA
jgi:hypothetical protein